MSLFYPIFTRVDPDQYSEYGTGSTKLMNSDPVPDPDPQYWEPEPVEPKLFETWSRNRSRNYLLIHNVTYLLQSVWRMLG